jgi:tetratricopeptide (TPR) repeat protein
LIQKRRILALQSKYDESVQALDKALELNPQLAGAWNIKGIALEIFRASMMKPFKLMIEL